MSLREGGLDAPTRHPVLWDKPEFYDQAELDKELTRVFDVCHGCRRCVSLCESFPTLFELVDSSTSFEIDGVDTKDFQKVVEQCFLCDLCYMTKCPYVPPHEWNIDFPHLMLRAKIVRFAKTGSSLREKVLSSTDIVGRIASIPVVKSVVNSTNTVKPFRVLLEKALGVHREASLPTYQRLSRSSLIDNQPISKYKVLLFAGCYANYNNPSLAEDLVSVYQHQSVSISLLPKEQCCGMPKYELGDIASVVAIKEALVDALFQAVCDGKKIVIPVPSCVLMMRQEWPLLFPNDEKVLAISKSIYDPCEFLMKIHREQLLNTNFKNTLGVVSYHASCHQRVQNIGSMTRQLLQLVPGTTVHTIERCSGHDGTYGVKKETYPIAKKLAKPISDALSKQKSNYFCSDCSLAGNHIVHIHANATNHVFTNYHPLSLIKIAYGI
ncbi:MAG: heterodisulfide reductase-related iron-sulfur binding cluster [Methylacidiphilales bacterium]|nr:heterodisulfide reductase-related iron-sulfur binding cluster [Candidatus Methylacidiphilales bacterium]